MSLQNDFIYKINECLTLYSQPFTEEEAVCLQNKLKEKVILNGNHQTFKTIAGIDVGYSKDGLNAKAAVVILDEKLHPIDFSLAQMSAAFPYIPGLLSFREIPVILEALKHLKTVPELLVCDGGGYAHPRRFGLACHLGVLLETPALGVAKTPFVGTHLPVGKEKGAWEPLMDGEEQIGAVLRTREDVKPLYISPGHLMSLEQTIDEVMKCTKDVRQPEPIRWAHHVAGGGTISYL